MDQVTGDFILSACLVRTFSCSRTNSLLLGLYVLRTFFLALQLTVRNRRVSK